MLGDPVRRPGVGMSTSSKRRTTSLLDQQRFVARLLRELEIGPYPSYEYRKNIEFLARFVAEGRPFLAAHFPDILDRFDVYSANPDVALAGRESFEREQRLSWGINGLTILLTTLLHGLAREEEEGREEGRPRYAALLETVNRHRANLGEDCGPSSTYLGESLSILKLFRRIVLLNRRSDKPILLLGEIGSGKSAVARLIHAWSPRRKKPFLEEQVTDSMHSDFAITKSRWLGFGAGARVGKSKDEPSTGLVQDAAGGTIFVDEIHRTAHAFQIFLLAVLDRRPIPLTAGKGPPVNPDVRLIFAMNISIPEALEKGQLQEDFLSRIEHWALKVPPLRERKDDIVLFLKREFPGMPVDRRLLLALLDYDWPRNVRELLDVLSRIGSLCDGRAPNIEHARAVRLPTARDVRLLDDDDVDSQIYWRFCRMLEERGLQRGAGLHRSMADLLGISESTVSRMAQCSKRA